MSEQPPKPGPKPKTFRRFNHAEGRRHYAWFWGQATKQSTEGNGGNEGEKLPPEKLTTDGTDNTDGKINAVAQRTQRNANFMSDGKDMFEMTPVDDWIRDMGFDDKPDAGEIDYARWLMLHWRLPAYMKHRFEKFIAGRKLFCTYDGERYRCIGGSRMGDVWLTANFEAETGYERRVDVAKCSAWSPNP